jgi:hypothetical protein
VSKFPLVNWKNVCMPIAAGGLGIKNLILTNQALLGKWFWRFATEKEAYWRKVVALKYGVSLGNWVSGLGRGSYGMSLWKYIRKGWDKFCAHTSFEVGNGACIRFWEDQWCGDQSLSTMFLAVYRIAHHKDAMIADYLSWNQDVPHWDVRLVRHLHDWEMVPFQNFMGYVYAQQVHRNAEDQIRWSPDHRGKFAVKSYYKVLAGRRAQPFPWKPIWKSKVPPRVAFFVWTAAKGKILTMDNLRKRGICIVDWCCLCKKSGESPDHLLLHCSYAQALWSFAFSLFGISWVMPAKITDLLTSWMGGFGKSWEGLVNHVRLWFGVKCRIALCGCFGANAITVFLRGRRLLPWILNPVFLELCMNGCL